MKKDFVHYQNHTRRDKKSQIETTVSAYSFENPKKSMAKIANSNNNRNVCGKNADANSFIAIKYREKRIIVSWVINSNDSVIKGRTLLNFRCD